MPNTSFKVHIQKELTNNNNNNNNKVANQFDDQFEFKHLTTV